MDPQTSLMLALIVAFGQLGPDDQAATAPQVAAALKALCTAQMERRPTVAPAVPKKL